MNGDVNLRIARVIQLYIQDLTAARCDILNDAGRLVWVIYKRAQSSCQSRGKTNVGFYTNPENTQIRLPQVQQRSKSSYHLALKYKRKLLEAGLEV